jgi:hypothetical protein
MNWSNVAQMYQRINKTLQVKMTADPGERAVIARISTIAVDRDGDVLLPSGLDAREFRKNPIVLLSHNTGSLPIGKVVHIEKTSTEVIAKVVFAERPESHPQSEEWQADTVLSLFRQKILNAFSVGFLIEDYRNADVKDVGKFGDGVQRVISKWRLLELSVVALPSNQEALALAVSKSWLGKPEIWGRKKSNKSRPLTLVRSKKLVLSLSKPLDISAA